MKLSMQSLDKTKTPTSLATNSSTSSNTQSQFGDEQQRGVRKISRFCVSRVQEQKSNENASNKKSTSGVSTPPSSTPPAIDLQAVNSANSNDVSSLINTPTEQLPTPLGGQQQTFQQEQTNPAAVATIVVPLTTQIQPSVLNLPQQTQPAVTYNPSNNSTVQISQQQQQLLQHQIQTTTALQQKIPNAGAPILIPNLHLQQQNLQHPLTQKPTTSPNQPKTAISVAAETTKQNAHQPQHNSSLTTQQQVPTSQQTNIQPLPKSLAQPQVPSTQPVPVFRTLLTPTLPQNSASYIIQPASQQHIVNPVHSQQSQIQSANQQPVYIHSDGVEGAMRMQMPQEEPVSLAATHPNLLPTVIQSDIKHNLDSLVNQLCNLRLGTNQHQRLLLLRQRQLIEEDELRLKHYVEYEKFQKAMRQCKCQLLIILKITRLSFFNIGCIT
ncbi:myb-like protein K [Lucilia cuprina]|uniref:myb-like protein K n=1 Tax=Lucilia cuprina TaxID=7375 RepID=UPI001F063BD4|nr:myb-like protein K [Lucilia cuprina]